MNQFIKTLIIINGILLPIILVFGLYQIIDSLITTEEPGEETSGIIVGEELEEARQDSLALQGLEYDFPQGIHNSSNYYIPVSVLKYEEAKSLHLALTSANDIGYGYRHIMNVVFLDSNFNVITTLLDRKASIADMQIRPPAYRSEKQDKNYRWLGYLIGFDDTNNDGRLSYLDHHDLFISDLNGKQLTQVSKELDIVDFHFNDLQTAIDIRYRERTGESEEHRPVKFARYMIKDKSLNDLASLNATLKDLEKQLISR